VAGKPRVVLFDVDGTLMLNTGGRSFYDWDRVGEDTPNQAVVELAQAITRSGMFEIVVMSGRDEVCYQQTEKSLDRHGVPYIDLVMRRRGDARADEIVKEELYREWVEPRYDVAFVVDDRDKVVRMWREVLGLTCLQVAPGDF
jgi:phosphoglycolate phosphatase-like HAD superfamily hydrolase